MIFLIVVGVLMAGYSTAYVASEDVRYITRGGIEESRILRARRPIAELAADPSTSAQLRGQLQLVLDTRNYAAKLGLAAKQTYTTYADVGRDTLLLNLSAAPKDCICAYTWKYPIVGRIPYKGFFDVRAAQRESDRLAAQGYDVYLRPAAAFSTLGWFNDPLLSTALTTDSMELAALVFHEIAHNSLYVKSATPFNESFAQLVAYRSAEHFFRDRGDSAAAQRAADRWHDEIVLGEYYDSLVGRLSRLYETHPNPEALDSGRAAAARWARDQLQGPIGSQLRTYRIGRLSKRPINNAQLVGARIYRTRLDLFDLWYQRNGADVNKTVAALRDLTAHVEGDSALVRLAEALGDSVRTEPQNNVKSEQ